MYMAKTDINTQIDSIDVSTIGTIDNANIFGEVERLAGDYGRVSELLLHATLAASHAKTRLDQLEGQIDLSVRQSCEVSGAKVTEPKIKSAVKATQSYVVAKSAVEEAEGRVDRCKAALKTLDKKERMLDILARFQIREFGINQRTQ